MNPKKKINSAFKVTHATVPGVADITTLIGPGVTDDHVSHRMAVAVGVLPTFTPQIVSAFGAAADDAIMIIFDQADEQGAAVCIVLDAMHKHDMTSLDHMGMLVPRVVADARRQAAAGNLVVGGSVVTAATALDLLDFIAPEYAHAIRSSEKYAGTNPVVVFAAGGISLRSVDRSTGHMIGETADITTMEGGDA